jgi:hypothetical protein
MRTEQIKALREKIAQTALEREISRLQWQNAMHSLLVSTVAAAGIGGVGGYLAHRRDTPVPRSPAESRRVDLPVLDDPTKEKTVKAANENYAAGQLQDAAGQMPSLLRDYLPFFGNSHTNSPWGTPGMVAASVGVPIVATLGGMSLGKRVADKQRRSAAKVDLRAAKREYDRELARLIAPKKEQEKQDKAAAAQSVDSMLDAIFEKIAVSNTNPIIDWIPSFGGMLSPETKGLLAGAGLLYSAAAVPLGYMTVDNAMRGPDRNATLAKALRIRDRLRAARRPEPLHVELQPRNPDESEPEPRSES